MTDKQRHDFLSRKYKAMLESRRGHNYEYWTEKHDRMLEHGWSLHYDSEGGEINSTPFECKAKRILQKYKNFNYYARIVCGYTKTQLRRKYYSVIYKNKWQPNY